MALIAGGRRWNNPIEINNSLRWKKKLIRYNFHYGLVLRLWNRLNPNTTTKCLTCDTCFNDQVAQCFDDVELVLETSV